MSSSSAATSKAVRPLLLVLALVVASCSRDFKRVRFDSREEKVYLDDLNGLRRQKDNLFKSGSESPLTAQQRTSFKHLNYYPPNLDLIFQVKLISNSPPKHIGIEATGGETRPAEEYGKFEFRIDGRDMVLHVYKMLGDNFGELFVPFTDETCGKTSYEGGRYLDLKENPSGVYTLDFNYAYNPYCAYNHNYSCPIVPKDNHLNVSINAGEMKYNGG